MGPKFGLAGHTKEINPGSRISRNLVFMAEKCTEDVRPFSVQSMKTAEHLQRAASQRGHLEGTAAASPFRKLSSLHLDPIPDAIVIRL